MKPEDLKKLVAKPESEELEFMPHLPAAGRLATLISAFANTKGGRLVIGIDDGNIVGLRDLKITDLKIKRALKAISPSLQVVTETIAIDDKSVLVVTIPKGTESPYLFAGKAFFRLGVLIKPITSQVIYSGITERTTSIGDLRIDIKRLAEIIEAQNRWIIAASSLKKKIPDMVIGGIIGALISLLIYFALGLQ